MRRLGSYEGLLPGLLFPYGKRGKPGGNYEGLLLPGFSPFPNARHEGSLGMEVKTWHRDRRSTKTPAVFEKRGESGQFRMFGSLGRNARKLRALGPSPRPLE